MKQILFCIVVIVLFIPAFIAILCRLLLIDLDRSFTSAAIGFFIASFMLLEMKFAYRPPKKWGASNPMKAFCHHLGKPRLYKIFCFVQFLVFLLAGIFSLLAGV